MGGEFSLKGFRRQILGRRIGTEPLHRLEQRVVIGQGPENAAHDATDSFPLAGIRQRRRGLGLHGDDNLDDASHVDLLQHKHIALRTRPEQGNRRSMDDQQPSSSGRITFSTTLLCQSSASWRQP
jgi:hypothetical protein